MASQIDQLRSSFSKMNTAQKKVFVENLTQKLKGVNNAEYTKFLNECVTTYSAEAMQGQSQQAAPVSRASPGGGAFCRKCGERLDAGAKFCVDCGAPASSAAAAYTAAPGSASALLNMPRKGVIIAICAVVLVAAAFMMLANGPAGGSGLTGTWEVTSFPWPGSFQSTVEFRGNRFTAISQAEFVNVQRPFHQIEILFLHIAGNNIINSLDFESIGNGGYRVVATGTYSISESGDTIEFVFSNGHIEILSFSRTENTFTIGHPMWLDQQFRRR